MIILWCCLPIFTGKGDGDIESFTAHMFVSEVDEAPDVATAIMREEAHQTQETTQPDSRRAMNLLAAGIGLVVIGAGLAFIMPPVGLVLIVVGFFAIVWGVVITWFKK